MKHAVLFVTNEDYHNEHQERGWSLALIRGRMCGITTEWGSFIPRMKKFIDTKENTARTNGNRKCCVATKTEQCTQNSTTKKKRPIEFQSVYTSLRQFDQPANVKHLSNGLNIRQMCGCHENRPKLNKIITSHVIIINGAPLNENVIH
jgi:hypothetical protein